VEHGCPADFIWQLQLSRGYWALCGTGGGSSNASLDDSSSPGGGGAGAGAVAAVERWVEATGQALVRRWRQQPSRVVGAGHRRLLQAAQRQVELHEAALIVSGLSPQHLARQHNINDLKSVVKTWR